MFLQNNVKNNIDGTNYKVEIINESVHRKCSCTDVHYVEEPFEVEAYRVRSTFYVDMGEKGLWRYVGN